jgi:hypothetical protein
MKITNACLDTNDINIIMESLINSTDTDIADSALTDLFISLSKSNSSIDLFIKNNSNEVVLKTSIIDDDIKHIADKIGDFFDDEIDDEVDDEIDDENQYWNTTVWQTKN